MGGTIVPITGYECEGIEVKIGLNTIKFCVSSFLCGIRSDSWPFYGIYCNWFDLSTILE